MKKPTKDDERLSALLDGQVSGPERDELLAHLAASDDDYEVFNDAAEILGALEEEDLREAAAEEPAKVIPMAQPRRPWRPPVRWIALAAVLAGVVVVSNLALRRGTPAGGDPVLLAALVHRADEPLPAILDEARPWSTPRGGDVSGSEDPAQAAQAGAFMVDLAVAVRAGNSAAIKLLATQVSDRFQEGMGGDTPLRQIAARPNASPDELERLLRRATDGLEYLGADYLQLGAWTRAGMLAAAAHQEEFFREDASRDMLRRAEQWTRGDDAAAVEQVGEALRTEPRDWDALDSALAALLNALAS